MFEVHEAPGAQELPLLLSGRPASPCWPRWATPGPGGTPSVLCWVCLTQEALGAGEELALAQAALRRAEHGALVGAGPSAEAKSEHLCPLLWIFCSLLLKKIF